MEKEKQVDTDSPLVTWLTPAIDSALAALTPPLPLISTCLLPAEAPPTGSGVGNLGRKWTKLNQTDKEESGRSWCLPPRVNGTQRKWEEDVWQLARKKKKSDMCNLGNLGVMIGEGYAFFFLFFFLKKFTFPHLAGRCHIASRIPFSQNCISAGLVPTTLRWIAQLLPNTSLHMWALYCWPIDLPPFWVM